MRRLVRFLAVTVGLAAVALLGAAPPAAAVPTPQQAACTNIEVYNSYLSYWSERLRKADGGTYTAPPDTFARNKWRGLFVAQGFDVFLKSDVPGDNGVALKDTKEYTITRWKCDTTSKWWLQVAPNGHFGSAANLAKANEQADAAFAGGLAFASPVVAPPPERELTIRHSPASDASRLGVTAWNSAPCTQNPLYLLQQAEDTWYSYQVLRADCIHIPTGYDATVFNLKTGEPGVKLETDGLRRIANCQCTKSVRLDRE